MSKHSFTIIINYRYTMFSISIVKYDIEWYSMNVIHAYTQPASFSSQKAVMDSSKIENQITNMSTPRVDKTL